VTDWKNDIEFLMEFRNKIDQYLFLGYAPPEDESASEFNAEALERWHEASGKQGFQSLSRTLNEMIPRAKNLLIECNVNPIAEQLPAPAVGGSVLRFNALDLIMYNNSEFRIPKLIILAAIDRAIGILKEKKSRKTRATPSVEEKKARDTPDEKFMRVAIELSKQSQAEDGRPHPKVGAVLVKKGEILDQAFRGEYAQGDHAEYTLLEKNVERWT
jgi:ribosomal protein S21